MTGTTVSPKARLLNAQVTKVVIALPILALLILEFRVAIVPLATKWLEGLAMWAGALLWLAFTVCYWIELFKPKNKSKHSTKLFALATLFTVFTACSFLAVILSVMVTFAHWVNVLISAVIFVVTLLETYRTWYK
jgi:putative Mn2+ efflux pump MntP